MSYEFKKLADVESLNEVPEVATVLAEVSGEIKRIPSSGLGGVVKTAIIKASNYDDAIAAMMSQNSEPVVLDLPVEQPPTFSCLNMTFEEAYEAMADSEPLDAKAMVALSGSPTVVSAQTIIFAGIAMFGVPAIIFGTSINGNDLTLFWTADGISLNQPGLEDA